MDEDSIPLLTDFEVLHYGPNIEMQIPMITNKFSLSKLIYETANSVVCSTIMDGEKYAIKFIPIDNEANAQKEALILQEKKHPHIIKFIDSFKSDTFFAIVMSYAMTDLTKYTNDHRFLSEKVAKKVMFDCLNAVEYLHRDGIWHLDLKTDNIFVMKDSADGPDIAIGDFGLACSTEYEKIDGRPVGSLNYAPPELIKLDYKQCYECSFLDEAQYSKKVDSFCLGEVMYYILCGIHPFELGENDGVRHLDGTVTFDIPERKLVELDGVNPFDDVSEDAKELIRRLICADPDERLSISDAKKHEWFKDVNDQGGNSDFIVNLKDEIDEIE